jgi:hypothetical protein
VSIAPERLRVFQFPVATLGGHFLTGAWGIPGPCAI